MARGIEVAEPGKRFDFPSALVFHLFGTGHDGDAMFTRSSVFLDRTRAGAWLSWSFSVFWTTRLFVQWFVYPSDLWRGKKKETMVHIVFTILWLWLALLLACAARASPDGFPELLLLFRANRLEPGRRVRPKADEG
jgi:hypothetical protein